MAAINLFLNCVLGPSDQIDRTVIVGGRCADNDPRGIVGIKETLMRTVLYNLVLFEVLC